MILPIYLYGSDVLRNENVDVDLNDKEGIATLLENMWETLGVADGCGLAAPQVGILKRVVVIGTASDLNKISAADIVATVDCSTATATTTWRNGEI